MFLKLLFLNFEINCVLLIFYTTISYEQGNPPCDQYTKECKQIAQQVCYQGFCRCKPNYRFNPSLNKCDHFDCKHNSDCRQFDQARICWRSTCICPEGYEEEAETEGLVCVKEPSTIGQGCNDIQHCGQGQRCRDHICSCLPSYKNDNGVCIKYACNSTVDCLLQQNDHRICISGDCVCDDGYHQSIDEYICIGNEQDKSTWWIYLLFLLILLPILFGAIYYFWRRSRNKKHPGNSCNQNSDATNNSTVNSFTLQSQMSDHGNPLPITINNEGTGMFNFNFYQNVRGNYHEPPPSYDSIPGQSDHSHANINVPYTIEEMNSGNLIGNRTVSLNDSLNSSNYYESVPAQNMINNYMTPYQTNPVMLSKLEQLSMQL